MRPIKFRGQTSKGKIVYGYFVRQAGLKSFQILDEHNDLWKVKTDSVAQLGDVIDGVEYYDGDERFVDGKSFICRVKTVWEAKS